ncbi:MAG: 3-oxoadipate enol-lactonase [Hyphomicrobiales bacterium]|jgi:3-oxoadipate enol-lactonase|nr:3-oxoadipate enol-lactonase [Hyphomicrobiales bacterium]
MPTIQSNGCPIHYEMEGDENKPVLMFCNSLGTTLHMWDGQMPAVKQHFRVLRYDRRGHGKSGVPAGPYNMEMLGRDALAVMDAAKVDKISWCGLSMGGMVGMWIGANAPQRVNKLILSNTSAYFENKQIWNDRIATVKEKGLGVILQGTLDRWFTKGFRDTQPAKVQKIADMFMNTKQEGYIACGEAVRDMDHREIIKKITAPTMVIAGSQDAGTTPEMGEFVAKNIPGATLKMFDAAHIANVECAHDYTDAVLGFLTRK